MADKIPILRVFDDDGNEYPIPAIQGRKGDRGDGDMNAADYDPQGRKEDIFAALDRHTHTAEDVGAATKDHTHTLESLGAAAADHTHTLESIGAAEKNHASQHGKDGKDPITPEAIGAGRVITGTYTGTGGTGGTIPFPDGIPEIVFIQGFIYSGAAMCAIVFPNVGLGVRFDAGSNYSCRHIVASVNGNDVIVDDAVLNDASITYRYTGIG